MVPVRMRSERKRLHTCFFKAVSDSERSFFRGRGTGDPNEIYHGYAGEFLRVQNANRKRSSQLLGTPLHEIAKYVKFAVPSIRLVFNYTNIICYPNPIDHHTAESFRNTCPSLLISSDVTLVSIVLLIPSSSLRMYSVLSLSNETNCASTFDFGRPRLSFDLSSKFCCSWRDELRPLGPLWPLGI